MSKYLLLMNGRVVKEYKNYQKHQFYKYAIALKDQHFSLVKVCLETQSW